MKIEEETTKKYKVVHYGINQTCSCVLAYGNTKKEAIEEYIKDVKNTLAKSRSNVEVLEEELAKAEAELEKCE